MSPNEVIYSFRTHELLDLLTLSCVVNPAQGLLPQLLPSVLGKPPSSTSVSRYHSTPLDTKDTIAFATTTVKHQYNCCRTPMFFNKR